MPMLSQMNQGGPGDRRQQLIAKLMQQAQGNAAAGAASLLPPSAATLGMASGTSLGVARGGGTGPQSTQGANISADILSALGSMGHVPTPSEVSASYGAAIPTPTLQAPSLQLPTHLVAGGGAAMPTPQAPVPTPAFNPSAPPPNVPAPTQAFQTIANQIPLGSGWAYDSILNDIVGPAPTLAPGIQRASGF